MWFNTEDGVPQGGGFRNRPRLKVHTIKVNKGKNKTTVKGDLFQVEYWEIYPSGHHCMCLWLKGNWKWKWLRH